MASPRKLVRDALRTALQHPTSGLNAKVRAVAEDHGIQPFEISWEEGSRQFLQGHFAPEEVDLSGIFEFPGLILYTSQAQSQPDREKFRKFAGDVTAQLDFYVEFRDGREFDSTEEHGECFEEALVEVMSACRSIFEAAGAYWNGDIDVVPDVVRQLTDGWAQRISATLTFEVTV